MSDPFEDHCWKDVVPPEVLEVYSHYRRETFIGQNPALLAVDLYELAYQGGSRPVSEVVKTWPSSCGEYAWAAIGPTKRLFAAARAAGISVLYSTNETRPESRPAATWATRRRRVPLSAGAYDIRPEFRPEPGDIVVHKLRASAFFGTALAAHLTQLGVRSLIICGESTSGCVRATAVDAYSHGFHVVLVEECCFDRFVLAHKISLFDLHHKYADVIGVEAVIAHLSAMRKK